jgi:uncharacterized protein YacL
MIYILLFITIFNTALIIYFFIKQENTNRKILEALFNEEERSESASEENKKHIDDMLKMREMYESD